MGYRIFLAGASGAIGRRLTPLLHGAGHYVCGSTRSDANADALRALGADPVVVDVFDAGAVTCCRISTPRCRDPSAHRPPARNPYHAVDGSSDRSHRPHP